MPELFSCTRLSARLTIKACGARFLRVRASSPGNADYDSACAHCPIGEHHARTGTLCPDTTTQTPTETPMAAHSEYTDDQKRDAVKRVLLENKTRGDVAESLNVSGTTIKNWIERFGREVASDAMDAASGKPAKAKAPKKDAPERVAKTILPPPVVLPEVEVTPRARRVASVEHVIDPNEAARVAMELGDAVRHIADKRARTAVADAAWLLSQVAGT